VDECDTAARVMECGKNALPDAFDDLVTAVDFTSVVRTLFYYSMVLLNPNSFQIKKKHAGRSSPKQIEGQVSKLPQVRHGREKF
jgi:hypothetical protein